MLQTSQAQNPQEGSEGYVRKWRQFALRYHIALCLVYGWVPVCVGLFLLSRYSIHQPMLSLAGMGAWLAAAVAAVFWAGEFRCPRCRRRYAALGHGRHVNWTRGLFDKICSNCKLRKFEQ